MTCFGLEINELPSFIARDIFKALFVDDLAVCFHGRSLDNIERHLQQAVNAIKEWATRNGFRFAAHKYKVMHFTAHRSRAQKPPTVRIGNTLLPLIQEAQQCAKDKMQGGSQPHLSGCSFEVGRRQNHTSDAYRAIVRSKLDYGCIVYGSAI